MRQMLILPEVREQRIMMIVELKNYDCEKKEKGSKKLSQKKRKHGMASAQIRCRPHLHRGS